MGVTLNGQQIRNLLARAHQLALRSEDFLDGQDHTLWTPLIARLRAPSVPKTYLAVFAVTLVARSLHDRDVLSIWDIKSGTSDKGYSASSIGTQLSSFIKTHHIDLRARSSQPMNNQPFTFKDRILKDPHAMTVATKHHGSWQLFTEALSRVEQATPDEAMEGLVALFAATQQVTDSVVAREMTTANANWNTVEKLITVVCDFVDRYPLGGKTGQALVAAALSTSFGKDNVSMGQINDPDAGLVGDVHISDGKQVWLWVEVKQKVVMQGDVLSFASKVSNQGGSRALYCAFANTLYPDHVNKLKIAGQSRDHSVEMEYFDSSRHFLSQIFRISPGNPQKLVSRFSTHLLDRITEVGCDFDTISDFAERLRALGVSQSQSPQMESLLRSSDI